MSLCPSVSSDLFLSMSHADICLPQGSLDMQNLNYVLGPNGSTRVEWGGQKTCTNVHSSTPVSAPAVKQSSLVCYSLGCLILTGFHWPLAHSGCLIVMHNIQNRKQEAGWWLHFRLSTGSSGHIPLLTGQALFQVVFLWCLARGE